MAILDDNDDVKIIELKAVDINDPNLPEGTEVDVNPDVDAWEKVRPQDDGTYKVALFKGKTFLQMGRVDDKNPNSEPFYTANLECKVNDDSKWKDTVIFGKVSTVIGAGKETSTMISLMRKMGVKVPARLTPKQQINLLNKCMALSPNLYVTGEWKAWDMSRGEWIKQGMTNFPKDENGKPNHLIRDSKMNIVGAKWKPTRWWGLKEWRALIEKEQILKQQRAANTQGVKTTGEVVGQVQQTPPPTQHTQQQQTPPVQQINAVPVAGFQEVTTQQTPVDEDFVIDM